MKQLDCLRSRIRADAMNEAIDWADGPRLSQTMTTTADRGRGGVSLGEPLGSLMRSSSCLSLWSCLFPAARRSYIALRRAIDIPDSSRRTRQRESRLRECSLCCVTTRLCECWMSLSERP